MKPEAGQKWKDRDRRREANGDVRTFEITDAEEYYVNCRNLVTGKIHRFRPERFTSKETNDAFVPVEAGDRPTDAAIEANAQRLRDLKPGWDNEGAPLRSVRPQLLPPCVSWGNGRNLPHARMAGFRSWMPLPQRIN